MDDHRDDTHPTRRRFLEITSASALFAGLHGQLAWAGTSVSPASGAGTASTPRIAALRLLTAAPLDELREFYGGLLGLPVLGRSKSEITIAGGKTPITFVAARPQHGAPFYHFAFNIPENKLRAAHDWQIERTDIDPIAAGLRDPAFPEGVVHFRNWNAHSVFFWDPAGNLVEYIARHDLDNAAAGPFTRDDILYASEIAFIVDEVPVAARGIREALELENYRPESEAFAAVGDEHGLLLVMRRGRRWGMDPEMSRTTEVFPTVAHVHGVKAKRYAVDGFPYEIRVD